MHRLIRGEIRYTSDKPGRLGHERGREYFTITRLPNGGRTLEAHCEIDDAPDVLRMVTTTIGSDWRPLDASVRIWVGGEFRGSSWFNFSQNKAECEGQLAPAGRLSQTIALEAPVVSFGAHPIQNDAWLCNAIPHNDGGSLHRLSIMVSSVDHRGATGPMLVPIKLEAEFVGVEPVAVAAGTFDALHFRFGADGGWAEDDPLKHPVYHLWCTSDGEFIFLKGHVEGYMQTRYELVSLTGLTR